MKVNEAETIGFDWSKICTTKTAVNLCHHQSAVTHIHLPCSLVALSIKKIFFCFL